MFDLMQRQLSHKDISGLVDRASKTADVIESAAFELREQLRKNEIERYEVSCSIDRIYIQGDSLKRELISLGLTEEPKDGSQS